MKQVIYFGTDLAVPSINQFFSIAGSAKGTTTESQRQVPISEAGTFRKLRYRIATAPGASQTITFTLFVNGSGTSVAVTFSEGETEKEDTTNTASVSAGDALGLKITSTGTPTLSAGGGSIEFEPTTAERWVHLLNLITGNSGAGFAAINAAGETPLGADGVGTGTLFASDHTIRQWRIQLSLAPGVGNTWVFFLAKAGTRDVASAITVSGTAKTGSATGLSIAVVAGDRWGLEATITLGTPASTRIATSVSFEPTTSGEYEIAGGTSDDLNATTTEFHYLVTRRTTVWTATEGDRDEQMHNSTASTYSKFRVQLQNAPGSGKSFVFRLRDDGANGNSVVTISDTSTTGNDGSNSDAPATGSLLNVSATPSGTPTGSDALWAFVGSVASTEIPSVASWFRQPPTPPVIRENLSY